MESEELKPRFLSWQCLVRQRAMRVDGGRPSEGMRPHLSLSDQGSYSGRVTLLLIHESPKDDIAQFRHMVKKTHDPADRYAAAIKYLSATYYQRAQEFSDQMTGSFAPDSLLARALNARGSCVLEFGQFGQLFKMECHVSELTPDSEPYQVTFWHNALFNSRIPPDVKILGFQPQWSTAVFEERKSAS
ncbi:MAG: hypothetical protein ACPHCM_04625 [Arenicellales bacterium]